MKRELIGVLDSGVGGLTVASELKKLLPNESIIYFGDSKNVPYSSKTNKEIYNLSRQITQYLLTNKAKIIVIACNTITVSALDKLREEFDVPIVGTVPVIKTAGKLTKNGKIGVFSTKKTAESSYQKKLIAEFAKGNEVLSIGTDEIVPLIERQNKEKIEKVLVKELRPFKKFSPDILVLGCTHFPLIKNKIQKILGKRVLIIDSGEAIARQVKRILESESKLSNSRNPRYTFYTTGDINNMKIILNELNLKGKVSKHGF